MNMIDATEMILKSYDEVPLDEKRRKSEDPPHDLHSQAAEMFIYMARHAIDKIDSEDVEYEDFTTPLIGLALTNCLVACERSTYIPSFLAPPKPDPWAKAAFSRQLMAEVNREQEARMRHGLWRGWIDITSGRIYHRITKRRRKSALRFLDVHAQASLLSNILGVPLDEVPEDTLFHNLAASKEVMVFLTKTDPIGWEKFELALGLNLLEISAFEGFIKFLHVSADIVRHSFWYDEELILKLWGIYIAAYPKYNSINSLSIIHALKVFSMTPSESSSYLIHPPFYKLHNKYLRNPCFIGGNIANGLLTIAIRIFGKAWSETLGSSLAYAADTLGEMMPKSERLKIAVRTKYSGGDIDLALYDTQTKELLICEVKTVYDKHGTDSLMEHFEEAKINVRKASSQLQATESAISSGSVTLKNIFKISDSTPARIHKALLTWFDPIDVTMGTSEENVMSLNFATFIWLVHRSSGDVQALVRTAQELRNIWAVSYMRPLDLGQPSLEAVLEVQTGLLDRREDLALLPLSNLSQEILKNMRTIDDLPVDTIEKEWISYFEDTCNSINSHRSPTEN